MHFCFLEKLETFDRFLVWKILLANLMNVRFRPRYAKAKAPRCNKSLALGTFRDHPKLGFTRGDIGSTSVCQRDILDNFTAIQAQARAASDAVAMARGVDTGPLPEER